MDSRFVGSTVSQTANEILSRAVLLCIVTLATTAACHGQDRIELSIDGPLTFELRAAIADLLDPAPQSNTVALLEAFSRSTVTGATSTLDAIIAGNQSPLWAGSVVADTYTVIAPEIGDPDVFKTFPPEFIPEGTNSATQSVVYVQRSSDLAKALGVDAKISGDPVSDSLPNGDWFAAPIDTDALKNLPGFGPAPGASFEGVSGGALLELNASTIDTLLQIERDLQMFGTTFRTLTVPPGKDEALARFQAAIAEIPTVRSFPAVAPSQVEQDLPEGALVLSGEEGACVADGRPWPFDVAKVAAQIQQNGQIMRAAGAHDVRRAKILVVDAGLPEPLAADTDFSRFLLTDPSLSLRQGYFWRRTANMLGEPECLDSGQPGESSLGVVTVTGTSECMGRKPFGGLAPEPKPEVTRDYLPDHGGLVGVLAAGGPDLIRLDPTISHLVGIGFAKIMQTDRIGGQVKSDASDVMRSFDYARKKGFNIVNTSLRVNSSTAQAIIEPKFSEFGNSGLIVAAAGNQGGPLQDGSPSYPASLARLAGDNDSLIVVGGLQPGDSVGEVRLWGQSNYSEKLVDIAAPAVSIPSLDGQGHTGCFTGTSAAAPQVSFAAGLLWAFGYDSPAEIKRRLLATAREVPILKGKVRQGRVLDLSSALDVFVDQIWLEGADQPLRVQLLSSETLAPNEVAMVRLCDGTSGTPLEDSDGWIDANRLVYWAAERTPRPHARIWYADGRGLSGFGDTCNIPATTTIRYLPIEGGEVQSVVLDAVDRIVPSRLRKAIAFAANAARAP